MLDQRDLELMQKMMESVVDSRITDSEKRMESVIDARITDSEKRMESVIDARITDSETKMEGKLAESENLILEEIERTRNIVEKQINAVQKNVDELAQYYRITKLENDNTALFLKMMDELSRRIEELEKKTA